MEAEVRAIQKELEMVQAERRGLELQKKLLTCTAAAPVKGGGDEQPSAPKIPNVGVSVPLPGVVPPVPINVGVAGPSEPICPSTGKTCAQEQAIGPPPPCKRQVKHSCVKRIQFFFFVFFVHYLLLLLSVDNIYPFRLITW